jgi:hypothetical protein
MELRFPDVLNTELPQCIQANDIVNISMFGYWT